MANSTFYTFTNRLLRWCGQAAYASTSAFGDDDAAEKVQLQGKEAVRQGHGLLMANPRLRFTQRTFTFNTVDGTATYNLSTNPDLLKEDSWRITTADYGRQLKPRLYREQWQMYPEGETAEGTPIWYYFPTVASGSSQEKVGLSPVPDAVYTVVYEGWIKPTPLSAYGDEILFPPEHEDVLLKWCEWLLEGKLAEGRTDSGAILEAIRSEMKANQVGAPEEGPTYDAGIEIWGRESWDYDIYTV